MILVFYQSVKMIEGKEQQNLTHQIKETFTERISNAITVRQNC